MGYPLKHASSLKRNNQKKQSLQPGTYLSKIVSVSDAKGYTEGDAYTLTYSVTVADGTVIEKQDTFVNNINSSRTLELVEYLAKNGLELEDFEDLIGLQENLSFTWSVSETTGRRFLNVSKREFLGFSPVEDDAT